MLNLRIAAALDQTYKFYHPPKMFLPDRLGRNKTLFPLTSLISQTLFLALNLSSSYNTKALNFYPFIFYKAGTSETKKIA